MLSEKNAPSSHTKSKVTLPHQAVCVGLEIGLLSSLEI
jgi:hypothetical protein